MKTLWTNLLSPSSSNSKWLTEPRDGKEEAERTVSGTTSVSKDEIRGRYKRMRAAHSPSALAELGLRVAANLCSSDLFLNSSKVALYAPHRGEVDVLSAFDALKKSGKRAFFPRVCGEGLKFFEVLRADELSPGSFSIPEPPADPSREAAVPELDLMVVPGLCFDRFGSRVGSGKGFYDRAAANTEPSKVCAVAYGFQFVDFELPCEPHDRRAGFVITERGVFRAQQITKRNGDEK